MNLIRKRVSAHIKKAEGIALIQVLIISIILTMLGIYINQTVRSQIGTVTLMKDAFELNLLLENSEAELLHALLTETPYRKIDSDDALQQQWNFHGKPFLLNENTTVIIQDLSGLLSLNIMDNTIARKLFEELGFSGHEVRTFLDSLADWKDKDDLKRLNGAETHYYSSINQSGPRNNFLQTLSEVESIKQGDLLTHEQWKRYFTAVVVSNFNPLNAPNTILKAFLNNDIAYKDVLQQREAGTLTSYSFYQATSIERGEFVTFSTGRQLKVTLLVKGQKNKLSKEFIVDLRPSSFSRPIVISQLTWNQV
jgi:general secretion pathway protein K